MRRESWDWEKMFAEICYYFPAYTLDRIYHTPFIQLISLHRQLGDLLKNDPRGARG